MADVSHGDERFRALFEHAPVGVALCEPDGSLSDVNPTFRDILTGTGIDPDHGNLLDLVRHAPDGADEARAWRDGLAAVRAGTAQVARVQLSVAPPDAPARWVQATAVRVVLGDHPYILTHLEDATGRRLEEQRLVRLAMHDGLTGLANRTLLGERLDAGLTRARTSGLPLGVLFLDLDHFKAVNDEHGHDVGDALLIAVAQRLVAVLRAGDTAGRLGGDEFLVLAADVPDEVALSELVRRVEQALAKPLVLGDLHVPVTASIGGVLSREGDQPASLLRRADAAMYAAKRARHRAEHASRTRDRQPELTLAIAGDDLQVSIVPVPRTRSSRPARRTVEQVQDQLWQEQAAVAEQL